MFVAGPLNHLPSSQHTASHILLLFTHKAIKIPRSKPLNGCETHFVGPAVFGLLHVRTFSSCSLTVTFKIGRHKLGIRASRGDYTPAGLFQNLYGPHTCDCIKNCFKCLFVFNVFWSQLVPENCSSNI